MMGLLPAVLTAPYSGPPRPPRCVISITSGEAECTEILLRDLVRTEEMTKGARADLALMTQYILVLILV